MTIKFEDVTGDLEVKANVDFMQFPENLFFTATPSVRTVLRLVFSNVNAVQLSSFVVKNYDNKSEISFESKDAQIFAVQRMKFPWVENKVLANSCRSEYGEVPCSQVFQQREAGPDSSMVVMMAIIIAITGQNTLRRGGVITLIIISQISYELKFQILFYFILFCFILFYFILFCFILYYLILFYFISFY